MKIPHYEALRRSQREDYRAHPWRMSAGGLYIPHSYEDMTPWCLTYWDDVGFILNGRKIFITWEHPRHVYGEALWDKTWAEVGDGPRDNWLTEGGTKNYRKVGRSRKKLVSYTCREPSPEQKAHYDQLNTTYARLAAEGVDLNIAASWKWRRRSWAMNISIVAPLEVRSETDLAEVARLAKRLIRWETTLENEFPGYSYGRQEWLQEQNKLNAGRDESNFPHEIHAHRIA